MIRIKKDSTWMYAFFLFTAIFYFYIAYNVPYTGDDWDWGLDIGLQHLLTADINSRYAGNLAVVIMTRSKLLQTLIMGTAYFVLPFLMAKLVVGRSDAATPKKFVLIFIAANCLLLSMEKQIWQQTYGWVSGFANYGISAVLLLVYLYLVDPLFADTIIPERNTLPKVVGLFLLGLVIQLFLENLALVMLVLSAALCLISCLRTGKIERKYVALLTGNILGLAIMFSSKIYPVLLSEGAAVDGGRNLTFYANSGILGPIRRCLIIFSQNLVSQIWENNLVICCSISVLLIVLFTVKYQRPYGKVEYALIILDVLSIPHFVLFNYLEKGKTFLQNYGLLNHAEVAVNVGFFLIVAVQIAVLYRNRKWTMWKLLILWTCAPLVIFPLSAVDIEGGRFYITSNCFMILVALHLLRDSLVGFSESAADLVITLGLSVLLSFSLFFTFLYRGIGDYTRQRIEIIEAAKETNAKDIVLPAYPYPVSDYVWWGEPKFEYREVYFREFFGLDPDVEMTFVWE